MTTVAAGLCTHYWEIEEARGPLSVSRCKHCGETRQMANYLQEVWDRYGGRFHLQAPVVEPATEKEEELMSGKLSGAAAPARAKELRPARQMAEDLFRQGRGVSEVRNALAGEFGEIAVATIYGWRKCMQPEASALGPLAAGRKARAARESRPTGAPALWNLVMECRPSFNEKVKLARWMELLDATYGFLVES